MPHAPAPSVTDLLHRRNRRRRLTALAIAAAIAALSLADHLGWFAAFAPTPADRDAGPWRVVAVPDQAVLRLSDPAGTHPSFDVRLFGAEPLPAKGRTADLAARALDHLRTVALGRSVQLEFPLAPARDPAGRLVAIARLADSGADLAETLVAAGLARADPRIPHPRLAPIEAAEQRARQQRLGLWGSDLAIYNGRTFRVVNVVDGDTLDLAAADGDRPHTRVRLWGIDTPEVHGRIMYFGAEASAFLRRLALHRDVRVELLDRRTRDRFGRLLAYLYLPGSDEPINATLVRTGHAYADTRFDHPRKQQFIALERLAREQRLGLWAHVTPHDMPRWRQRLEPPTAATAP